VRAREEGAATAIGDCGDRAHQPTGGREADRAAALRRMFLPWTACRAHCDCGDGSLAWRVSCSASGWPGRGSVRCCRCGIRSQPSPFPGIGDSVRVPMH
jgi:hypothetical protein